VEINIIWFESIANCWKAVQLASEECCARGEQKDHLPASSRRSLGMQVLLKNLLCARCARRIPAQADTASLALSRPTFNNLGGRVQYLARDCIFLQRWPYKERRAELRATAPTQRDKVTGGQAALTCSEERVRPSPFFVCSTPPMIYDQLNRGWPLPRAPLD
jgi:hypothetical protein